MTSVAEALNPLVAGDLSNRQLGVLGPQKLGDGLAPNAVLSRRFKLADISSRMVSLYVMVARRLHKVLPNVRRLSALGETKLNEAIAE